MGSQFCNIFSGSQHGVVWNKSSHPIIYEIEGPWQEITQDKIDQEFNPTFKTLPVGFEITAGQLYKRGKVINHQNVTTVEVALGNACFNGLYKVKFGETKISIKTTLKENDYIIKNEVINSVEQMRICIKDNKQIRRISKETAKQLSQAQTETAQLGQEEDHGKPDQDDIDFLKALKNQKEEH